MSVDKAVGALVAGSLVNNLGSALFERGNPSQADWRRYADEMRSTLKEANETIGELNASVGRQNAQVLAQHEKIKALAAECNRFKLANEDLSKTKQALQALREEQVMALVRNVSVLGDLYRTQKEALQAVSDVADQSAQGLLLAEARMIEQLYSQAAHILALPRLLGDLNVAPDSVAAARAYSVKQLAQRDGGIRAVLDQATRTWIGRAMMSGAAANITVRDASGSGRLIARIRVNDDGKVDLEHFEPDIDSAEVAHCRLDIDGYEYPYSRSPTLSILAGRMAKAAPRQWGDAEVFGLVPAPQQIADPAVRLPGESEAAHQVRLEDLGSSAHAFQIRQVGPIYRRLSLNLDEYQHAYSDIKRSVTASRERVEYQPVDDPKDHATQSDRDRQIRALNIKSWRRIAHPSGVKKVGQLAVNSGAYQRDGVALTLHANGELTYGDHHRLASAQRNAEASGMAHPLADLYDQQPLARFRIAERVVHAILGLTDEKPDQAFTEHESPITQAQWDECVRDLSRHLIRALDGVREVTPQVERRLSAEEETASILNAPSLDEHDGVGP